MIRIKVNKLFELLAPERSCEYCGTPCKTALCTECREELTNAFSGSTTQEEVDAPTTEKEPLSA